MTLASASLEPALPGAAGPLSTAILEMLTGRQAAVANFPVAGTDPYGLDLELALYVCYELAYRGFAGVDPEWAWDAGLLRVRADLKRHFLSAVRTAVGEIGPDDTAAAEMDALSVEPVDGEGPSYCLRDEGTWEQMRECFVHRSLYHLKEADPHRLRSRG